MVLGGVEKLDRGHQYPGSITQMRDKHLNWESSSDDKEEKRN